MKKIFFFIFVLFCIKIFPFYDLQYSNERTDYFLSKFGKLEIVSTIPENNIFLDENVKEIIFTFSKDIIPLQSVEKINVKYRSEPIVKGIFRAKGKNSIVFYPEKPFSPNLSYKFVIEKGILSIDSTVLSEDFVLNIKPVNLEVVKTSTYPVHSDSFFYIIFNYKVPIEILREKILLERDNKKVEFLLEPFDLKGKNLLNHFYYNLQDTSNFFCVKFKEKGGFKKGKYYSLKIFIEDFMRETTDISFPVYDNFKYIENKNTIIPIYDNKTSFDLEFSTPVSLEELMKNVYFISDGKDEDIIDYSYYDVSKVFFINKKLVPQKEYFINIKENLRDIFNEKIENPGIYRLIVSDYQQSLFFNEEYLRKNENLFLNFSLLNISKFDIYLKDFYLKEFIKVFSKNDYPYDGYKEWKNKSFSFPVEKNLLYTDSLNIEKEFSLKNTLGFGVIEYESDGNKFDYNFIFQRTPFKLNGIFSKNNGFLILSRYDEGNIYHGKINLSIFNQNSEKIFSKNFEKGILKLTKKDLKYFTCYEKDFFKFLSFENREGNLTVPLFLKEFNEEFKSYIFTDRNLYQLSDSVIITGIVRKYYAGKIYPPSKGIIKYQVLNPEYKKIIDGFKKIGKDGIFNTTLFIPDTFKTGTYYVTFFKDDLFLGETSFIVGEFKEPKFEIFVESKKEVYKKKEIPEINIKANYLSKTKMSKDSLYLTLQINEVPFYSKKFSDFNFYINDGNTSEEKSIEMRNVLNEEGEFLFRENIPFDIYKNPVSINLIATVKDKTKESISKEIRFIKNTKDIFAGLKVSHISEKDDSSLFEIVCIDEDENFVGGENIEFLVYRILNYEKEIFDTIKITSIKSEGKVDSLWLKLKKDGNYRAEISYRGLKVVYDFYYGFRYYFESDREDIIIFKDKEKYEIGDTVNLKIFSKDKKSKHFYYCSRDSIFNFDSLNFEVDTEFVKIPVVKELSGGFYFSIFNLKSDPDKKEPKLSNLFVDVSVESKRTDFDMKTDKDDYKPGDTVEVVLKSGEEGEINSILLVVDESVLMLTGYNFTDPLNIFYSYFPNRVFHFTSDNFYPNYYYNYPLRMAKTESFENTDNISISEISTKEQEGYTSASSQVPVDKFSMENIKFRKYFKSLVYYSKNIKLEKNNPQKIKIILPDNIGKFRIISFAFNDEKFNIKQKSIRVEKKLNINTSFPLFLRPYDRVDFSFNIIDNTLSKGNLYIDIFSNQIKFLEKNFKEIQNNENVLVEKFKGEVGFDDSVKIDLIVRKDSFYDAVSINIPVINHNLYEYNSLFSSTDSQTVEEYFSLSKDIIKSKSNLKISLNSTLVGCMNLPLDYLKDYPYLCLEQKLSRIFPFIIGENIINLYGMSDLKGKKLKNFVNSVLKDIEKYQTPSGGFKYYRDDIYENEYLSLYTLYVLFYAKKAGYYIKDDVINLGLNYTENILNDSLNGIWQYSENDKYSLKTFALFILYLYDKKDYVEKVEEIFKKRDKLFLSEKARLLELLYNYGLKDEFNILLSEIKSQARFESDYLYFEERFSNPWFFNNNLKATSVVLTTLLRVNGNYEYSQKVVNYFLKNLKNGFWCNTHITALVLESLNEYYRIYEKENTFYKISLKLNGKLFYKKNFKGRKDNISNYILDGKEFEDTINILTVEKKGKGRVYYTLKYRYAKNKMEDELFNGFFVEREYLTLKDEPVSSFKKGEFYKVKIKIKSDKDRNFVLLEDNLPSGFEIVKKEFVTEFINLSGLNYKSLWWGDFYNEEFYKDRVITTSIYFTEGEHVYTYFVKAINSGEFYLPPANVFEMYNPEVFGHTKSEKIIIE